MRLVWGSTPLNSSSNRRRLRIEHEHDDENEARLKKAKKAPHQGFDVPSAKNTRSPGWRCFQGKRITSKPLFQGHSALTSVFVDS